MQEIGKWVDNTRIGCLERCPREFFYRHCLGLAPPYARRLPQAFGNALHRAIQASLLETLDPIKGLERALEEWETAWMQEVVPLLGEEGDDYRAEKDTGEALLRCMYGPEGGLTQFLGMIEGVHGVELRVEVPVPGVEGWVFVGRADVVARLKIGADCLMDIKTTGWSLTGWHEKMLVDTQLHSYAWALREMGFDVYSACYVVGKVQRRKLKDGRWSPNISVDSGLFPVACTEDQMEKMAWRMRRAALELQGRLLVNQWECRFSSCLQFSKVCGFQPLCERFWKWDSPDWDEVKGYALELGFREERWHPFAEAEEEKEGEGGV